VGFRFLFIQPNNFLNIRFFDYDVGKKSGRRYDNIPCFVRKIEMILGSFEMKIKVWSLGTTQFGSFLPVGSVAGGEQDQIVLTNLGTPAWIAPVGTILASSSNTVTLEDVNSIDAENRSANLVGKAWKPGYKVGLVNAHTHEIEETLTIDTVVGDVVTFTTTPTITIAPTLKNSAGFFVSGHYLSYSNYDLVVQEQTTKFGYFTKPMEGSPVTTTSEIEEQRA